MKKSAGAIIVYDKKILMLLRDNDPSIPDPDCWQLIGGNFEPGELPIETLLREVKEEINIQLEKEKVEEIGKIIIPQKQEYYLYWIKLTKEQVENVKLGNEGQKVEFISLTDLAKIKLGENLFEYFKKYQTGLKNLVERGILNKESLGFNKSGVFEIKSSKN